MEIQVLGTHTTEAKGMRLASFLIDGTLALDAGGLTSSLSLSEQEKVKTILLTHHHFDHVRDLVMLGANGAMFSTPVEVYALSQTLDIVSSCLLDGRMYVDLSKWPSAEKPFLQLKTIEPLERQFTEDYEILPVPVKHSVPAVGYQVTSKDGKSLFYTGDTGPGLSTCWEHISPQLLMIEVSGCNEVGDFLRSVGHLSALLLKDELSQFRQIKGYLPRIVAVHIPPQYQKEVEREVGDVARELGADITVAYEGMSIAL